MSLSGLGIGSLILILTCSARNRRLLRIQSNRRLRLFWRLTRAWNTWIGGPSISPRSVPTRTKTPRRMWSLITSTWTRIVLRRTLVRTRARNQMPMKRTCSSNTTDLTRAESSGRSAESPRMSRIACHGGRNRSKK